MVDEERLESDADHEQNRQMKEQLTIDSRLRLFTVWFIRFMWIA